MASRSDLPNTSRSKLLTNSHGVSSSLWIRMRAAPAAATTSSMKISPNNLCTKRTKEEHHRWMDTSSGFKYSAQAKRRNSGDRDRHLAEMRAARHVRERGLGVRERKHPVHHRLDVADGER